MITRKIFRSVFAVLSLMVLLVLLADFLESAGRLIESSGMWNVLFLYACKVPSVSYLSLPVAFVVGACIVFASMGRHGELRALAASGLGPVNLLKPVFVFGVGLAVFVFLLGEVLVPPSADEMEQLMEQHFGRIDSSWRFFRNHQWTKGDSGRLIRVGHKSRGGETLDYVIALQLDERFHVSRRLDARRLVWQGESWLAERVELREFEDSKLISYKKLPSATLNWTEDPDLFCDFSGRPQQKNIIQLMSAISSLKRRGLASAEYSLELHRRFAYPFMGILMVLFLFPWLSSPVGSRSTSAAVVQATVMVFAGYLIVAFCTTAVSGGLLPPWLGAWVPPLLFSVACIPAWFMSRSRIERPRP